MNILVLSCGTRNKIIQYLKNELSDIGKVVATDCSKYAPALYEADTYYIVPRITDSNYLNIILDICKKEKINAVLSLIDPELTLLAKNKRLFNEIGVTPIVSDLEQVEMSFDKMKMFDFCTKHNIETINSYSDLNKFKEALNKGVIDFPVFVKPYCGSCSVNIQKVCDLEHLEQLFDDYDGLMVQEFMNGQEIGADVYIDPITHKVVSIFTKKKLLMRAGETDKALSFKDNRLFDFITNFVESAGFSYNIDIDVFELNGKYYISEVNPRFGGGYPHAYECGCNFMKYIVNSLNNNINHNEVGNYKENIVMMKYLDVMIKEM